MGRDENVEDDPFLPEDFADSETFTPLQSVGRVIARAREEGLPCTLITHSAASTSPSSDRR